MPLPPSLLSFSFRPFTMSRLHDVAVSGRERERERDLEEAEEGAEKAAANRRMTSPPPLQFKAAAAAL